MPLHGSIPATQPHLSLNVLSVPSLSREERNGGGERPSFKGSEGVVRFVSHPLLGVTLRG
jgi:hypothetical protein